LKQLTKNAIFEFSIILSSVSLQI